MYTVLPGVFPPYQNYGAVFENIYNLADVIISNVLKVNFTNIQFRYFYVGRNVNYTKTSMLKND